VKKAFGHIIFHLIEAERHDEAEALLCDFGFVVKKAEIVIFFLPPSAFLSAPSFLSVASLRCFSLAVL
jgi:hypothetical protein